MKRLELMVPSSLLDDLGILAERFFRHNSSVQVLQSFSVRPGVNALIVRVRRNAPFKDETAIRREARAIARRYRVGRFELLSTDGVRKEYVAWVEWSMPRQLRSLLGEEWSGIVPLEVAKLGPREARVVFLASEEVLPVLRRFLEDVDAPYRVRAMRNAAPDEWQPLGSLTRRQRDLLELAYHVGYYATPAKAGLQQIASLVGISKAAVSKHLRAAERKLLAAILGAGP
ncbi:MAG TPA: helix-turn-helix domain-containing protein [Thermoplasmata archaeon]|jgi:hypothetical protein